MLGQLRTRTLIAVVLGLAVFGGLLLWGDVREVAQSLGSFRWSLLPLIILLVLFNYALRFSKWQYYLRLTGIRNVPAFESALIFCAGMAMTITPAKIGEWLKSYYLREGYGAPVSRTAPIVLAERLTDGFGMVLLAAGGLLLVRQGWLLLVIVTAVGVLPIVALRYRPFARWTMVFTSRTPVLKRFGPFLEGFYASSNSLLAWKPLLISTLLAAVSWGAEGIALYLVYLGLGTPNSWELAVQGIFIFSITTLAGVAFLLPGGLGVAEGGLAGFSQTLVDLSRDAAAAATLLIRLLTLWFGVAIGLMAMVMLTKRLKNNLGTTTQTGVDPKPNR